MTCPRYTRQQARAEKRAIFRALRQQRKATAMKKRDRGGAAAVR
jgi:hypothetical protein